MDVLNKEELRNPSQADFHAAMSAGIGFEIVFDGEKAKIVTDPCVVARDQNGNVMYVATRRN